MPTQMKWTEIQSSILASRRTCSSDRK